MESGKKILFLTGCVNPKGMSLTVLQDPQTRLKQYVDALKFYINETDLKVLFVENSGYDISEYFEEDKDSGRLEIITFDGNNYDKSLGKGYGEMLIIEHALKNSLLIQQCNFIFKITGRYKVLNINSIIKQHHENPDIEVLVDFRETLAYSDSRCWGGSVDFFRKLISHKNEANDSKGIHFEHVLCKVVHLAIINNQKYSPLKYMPRYSGTVGSTNAKFNDSFLFWFPRNLKNLLMWRILKS